MQGGKNAAGTVKESTANISASAKASVENTKATVDGQMENMKARPMSTLPGHGSVQPVVGFHPVGTGTGTGTGGTGRNDITH
ncbi:18 kDa seed maturation protein-like [Corylus avellana]|uniref:18 kDa seed maturation protein-like n=1 Tax=Corylus avellana TaxID=13451 RepID=UPI00286A093B|nr:18 kDa seed maturation protein-like [Corylus avellana]